MKATTIRNSSRDNEGTWVEFLPGTREAFITVARGEDREDDERVALVSPAEALRLAAAMVKWAEKEIRR